MPDLRFAVHTTATREQIEYIAGLGDGLVPHIDDEVGCFYGWGEPLEPERGCIRQSVIYDTTLATAQWWARELVDRLHQVVVTTHDDWSVTISNSTTPIYYRAEHQH